MYTVIETITPEKALHILTFQNTRNRPLSLHRARIYANDMANGEWDLTHQGIAFYSDGVLADGQTRLKAITIAGIPIKMSVTYDLESGINIDGVRPRSMRDRIASLSDFDRIKAGMSGITSKNIAIIRIELGTSARINQIMSFFEKYQYEFDFINSLPKTTLKNGQLASVQLAILRAVSNAVDEDALRVFYRIYLTGVCDNSSQWAAVRLRNHILESKRHDHRSISEYSRKAQFAIQCFIEKKPIVKIMLPARDIYPLF